MQVFQMHDYDQASNKHCRIDNNSMDEIDLLNSQATNLNKSPSNVDNSRFPQASFYDNEFSAKDLGGTPSKQGGQRLKASLPPSESVCSDFTGVVTVQDFGIESGWNVHKRSQSRDGHTTPCPSCHDEYPTGKRDNRRYIYQLRSDLDGKQITPQRSKNSYSFLPMDELLHLLRESNIKRVLGEANWKNSVSIEQMARDIYDEAPRYSRRMILATLLLMDKVESITHFIENDIYDYNLPLKRYRPGNQIEVYGKEDGVEHSLALRPLPDGWLGPDIGSFCLAQYQIFIPFFDMGPDRQVRFYKIEDSQIRLPFLESHEGTRGGYGSVRRIKIHRAHHNYEPLNENPYFAEKEVLRDEVYKDEIGVLERFSGHRRGHKRLIRLLMALQHGDKYYLIFPLADGNLVDFWEQMEMTPATEWHVRWVLTECLDIVSGLREIHHHTSWYDNDKNEGRHGDIKPENILCFATPEGSYRLVISDFGLTSFHSAHSVSNVPPERIGGLSRTYRPPEFDMGLRISQAYDMWSLGCLFLEFISWFLVGWKETRKSFVDSRVNDDDPNLPGINIPEDKFFNITKGNPVVKKSVKTWIDKLRDQCTERCPSCVGSFLGIIEDGLLNPEHQNRYTINKLELELKEVCKYYGDSNGDAESSSKIAMFEKKVIGQLNVRLIASQYDSKSLQDQKPPNEDCEPRNKRQEALILNEVWKSRGGKTTGLDAARYNSAQYPDDVQPAELATKIQAAASKIAMPATTPDIASSNEVIISKQNTQNEPSCQTTPCRNERGLLISSRGSPNESRNDATPSIGCNSEGFNKESSPDSSVRPHDSCCLDQNTSRPPTEGHTPNNQLGPLGPLDVATTVPNLRDRGGKTKPSIHTKVGKGSFKRSYTYAKGVLKKVPQYLGHLKKWWRLFPGTRKETRPVGIQREHLI